MKILLVSDDSGLSNQLESTLKKDIGETKTVIIVDIQKAGETARKELPDIVIMDTRFTDSLLQILDDLKAVDEDMQVLVLTEPEDNDLLKIIEHGIDDFILKPLKEEEFAARLIAAKKARQKLKALHSKERTLNESARYFRTLLDHTPDWEYFLDASGNYSYVSPSCEQITGYSPECFINEPGLLKRITHPDDRSSIHDHTEIALKKSTEQLHTEFRITHRNGEVRWISHICKPVFISESHITGRRASNRDITSQKQLEEGLKNSEESMQRSHDDLEQRVKDRTFELALSNKELQAEIKARRKKEEGIRAHNKELRVLYVLSSKMRAAKSTADLLPLLLNEACRLLRSCNGVVLLLMSERTRFTIAFGKGHWKNSAGLIFPAEEGLSGIVLRTEKPYVSKNYSTEAQAHPLNYASKIGPAVFVPLRTETEIIGCLAVTRSLSPDVRSFTDPEVRLLSTIGEMAGIALHRELLCENAQHNLEILKSLRSIDMAITGSIDLRVTLKVVLDEVMCLIKADAAAILRFDPYTGTLHYEAWRGFRTASLKHISLRLNEGYGGRSALERTPIYIDDLTGTKPDRAQGQLMADEGFAAYCAIPLVAKGNVQGVLEVFHRKPIHSDGEWLEFLETLAGQAAIAIDNAELFHKLERSNFELLQAYDSTIEGWAYALDLKDEETKGHSRRVTDLTTQIAREMGIKQEDLVHVRRGALLHDIGKMGIPDSILLKPGKLTKDEWEIMRQHPRYSFEMLSPVTYLRHALDIPRYHHEKWDGSGYLLGIEGEKIPLAARIFAVVDVYDALTNDRYYRPAWTREKALDYIRQQRGKHFDPLVADLFLKKFGG